MSARPEGSGCGAQENKGAWSKGLGRAPSRGASRLGRKGGAPSDGAGDLGDYFSVTARWNRVAASSGDRPRGAARSAKLSSASLVRR